MAFAIPYKNIPLLTRISEYFKTRVVFCIDVATDTIDLLVSTAVFAVVSCIDAIVDAVNEAVDEAVDEAADITFDTFDDAISDIFSEADNTLFDVSFRFTTFSVTLLDKDLP